MPNYNAHIGIAKEAASLLGHPILVVHMGSYLLGSTAPDMRIITGGVREEYHFAPLGFEELGAGVQGLFSGQPHLAVASNLQEPAQAFLAGYISHIIADELWILRMYRPFFGNREVFSDTVLSNLMDRALQLELDRQARERLNEMREIRPLIEKARNGIDVGFIPQQTISLWRNWLLMAIDKRFDWTRLYFMARRFSSSTDEATTLRICEEFLESAPRGLERIYEGVPRERVLAYKEHTVQETIRVVESYLS